MTAKVSSLGHVGLYAADVATLGRFYADVLGMTITDRDPDKGRVFLSARPDEEHHELLLVPGGDANSSPVQQLSFRCAEIEDLRQIYQRLCDQGLRIDMTVSHGNALGVYFFDPEGNRCEVYWDTGIDTRQPYLEPVDLTRPADELQGSVHESVHRHGGGPYVDQQFIASRSPR